MQIVLSPTMIKAEVDDETVGVMTWKREPDFFEVTFLYVHPDHTRALVAIMAAFRKAHAPVSLRFEASPSNEPMMRLCTMLGARQIYHLDLPAAGTGRDSPLPAETTHGT